MDLSGHMIMNSYGPLGHMGLSDHMNMNSYGLLRSHDHELYGPLRSHDYKPFENTITVHPFEPSKLKMIVLLYLHNCMFY